jgi:hypothetical protein
VPQNLIDLWAVVTRPAAYNGLGLTTVAALAKLERLKNIFFLLPERPAIFPAWEALVGRYQCPVNQRMTRGLSPRCRYMA